MSRGRASPLGQSLGCIDSEGLLENQPVNRIRFGSCLAALSSNYLALTVPGQDSGELEVFTFHGGLLCARHWAKLRMFHLCSLNFMMPP